MKFSKKFVCEDTAYSTYNRSVPAPLFRKSFKLDSVAESAEILICGLGFYELFVNGNKITKGPLAPYISNSDHYTYFDKYDLLPYIKCGENVIGIMLGDGHQNGKTSVWNFNENITNSAPLLALFCKLELKNKTICFEADDFVCKKGPILFNDLRSGIFYDARLEETGWNNVDFIEEDWHKPIMAAKPRGKAKLCEAESICIYREIKPVSIKKGERTEFSFAAHEAEGLNKFKPFEAAPPMTGGYIYDFGENNSGIYRLKIKGERGQKISLQFAEQLTDGKVNYSNINFYPDGFAQRDIYYLRGDGEEIFEPMFTYHGYRYIYVSGITEEQAAEGLLTYLVMSSSLEERGTFSCSDEMANTIYKMGRRSDISNFFYFPVDCPHREKNGWTGDAATSAEHMILTIGTEKSWREWLNNIRAAQTETGMLPGIVPTDSWGYEWGNGPAYDRVLFDLPYFAYKYRGDTEIIKENAAAMMRYLEYISRCRDERGIVETGLGDWVPVGRAAEDYEADLGFTGSVMVLDMCRKASVMFDAIGLGLHKNFAEQLAFEMLTAIRREYVDFNTYIVRKECQTSQAMAIFYDVFTEEEKTQAFKVLIDILRKDNNDFTCGFLGMRVLFHVLAQFGEAELAYEMITKKDFPSYGYWAEKGETTFLEQFYLYDDFYASSKNHHFLGDVLNWFMNCIAGLKVENSKQVKIKPCLINKLSWCEASHKLPTGEIKVRWEKQKNEVLLYVEHSGDVKYEVDEKWERLENGLYRFICK